MRNRDLTDLLAALCDSVEDSNLNLPVGVIRQAARVVAQCGCQDEELEPRCRRCGRPLVRSAGRGRPRVLCEVCSPPRRHVAAKSRK